MSEGRDGFDLVSGLLADAAERATDYATVLRTAVDRNASNEYAAADLLVDLQTVWSMAIRDAAKVGVAVVEALAPLIPGGDDAGGDPPAPS